MANCRQSLIPGWLLPGLFTASLLFGLIILIFTTLWQHAQTSNWQNIWHDNYLWHVIRFTFWQALLSTLLSILPAIFLARALYRRRFPGRQWLLRLSAMTLVLPVLVALFGILSVYGNQGWLAQLSAWLGIEYRFSIYGLPGILLAHTFFNLPLATRLLLQSLAAIAVEQRQLAAQLGMNSWQYFRWIEWHYLRRQILPTSALIFMLCFASFATVLALGGGPQATTIELAIYQALSYDYDLERAAILALIQLTCCLGLVLLSQRLNNLLTIGHTHQQYWRDPQDNRWQCISDTLFIGLFLLFLLPPLLAVMIDGCNQALIKVLQQKALWQALITSLIIAISASLLCLVLTMMLLWSSRELKLRQQIAYGQTLEISGMMILATPSVVLATGFFLLLKDRYLLSQSSYGLVIFINALMALPYSLKVLTDPMQDLAQRYNRLCSSLNIRGWQRLRQIECRALQRPLTQALAFSCVLSLGDFGIVALFGDEEFRTLPFYLYQQINAYRSQDGGVTALLLLLLCLLLFTLIERLASPCDHT